MSILRLTMSMSLDGFIAGPGQDMSNPLGQGGDLLHAWAFELRAFREHIGLEGGITNESTPVFERWNRTTGATIMGRNVFGGQPGPWANPPWTGWWGSNPPFHHPVFVLTHFPRSPLQLDGETKFIFVTDGIEAALAQARAAADERDVMLVGGAQTAQQYLRAGLVDEMDLSLVPVLLGGGERLFRDIDNLGELRLLRTIPAPKAVHLFFARA